MKYFDPAKHSRHHFSALAEFIGWYNSYFEGVRSFTQNSTCQLPAVLTVQDLRVSILLINSALFCLDNEDHGKLWIGRRCLREAINQLNEQETDIRIALIHHPLDWLHGTEQTNIRTDLRSAVDIVLRGHLHESDVESAVSNIGSVFNMAAGASYQTRDWPNRALFTRVHFDLNEVVVYPIHYVDNPTEDWTTDSALFPREKNHEGVFSVEWKSKIRRNDKSGGTYKRCRRFCHF